MAALRTKTRMITNMLTRLMSTRTRPVIHRSRPYSASSAALEMDLGSGGGLWLKDYEDYRKSLYGGSITHKALFVDAVGTFLVPAQPMAQIYREIGEKYGVKCSEDEILSRYRWAYEQPWGRSSLRYVDDGRPFWQHIVSSSTGCTDAQYFEELYNYYTTDKRKLSIPVTVSRALKYLPELQKEVDKLIHKKDELLSKLSRLQGITSEEKPKKLKDSKDVLPNSCSISTSIIGDNEIVIQISTFDNISVFEVINKLENDGLIVLDISSFRSFGGTTFYNLHLWSDGANNTITCEKLNEELPFLILGINRTQIYY